MTNNIPTTIFQFSDRIIDIGSVFQTNGPQRDIFSIRIIRPPNQGCRIVGTIQAWAIKHITSFGSVRCPTPKFLIERSSSIEHISHVCYVAYIPATDILIESHSSFEHPVHACYVAHVPTTYILIKWICTFEHGRHVFHITHIPTAYNLIEWSRV